MTAVNESTLDIAARRKQLVDLTKNLNTLQERQAKYGGNAPADCLEDESLNVRWILSLPTEFFGSIANFRPRIRTPYENDFLLNRLNSTEAATVITTPAAKQGVSFEPTLIEALLADLRDPDTDKVSPAQIHI